MRRAIFNHTKDIVCVVIIEGDITMRIFSDIKLVDSFPGNFSLFKISTRVAFFVQLVEGRIMILMFGFLNYVLVIR